MTTPTNYTPDTPPNPTPGLTTGAGTSARRQGGWLWVSAGVMAALVVVQGAGLLDRPAKAEMVTDKGGYVLMTTNGGSTEIMLMIDERNETLLVYDVENQRRVILQDRQALPDLFNRARMQAGFPARP